MSEVVTQAGVPAAFEELRSLWQRSIEDGNLEEAEEIIRGALTWAREHADQVRVDSAVCSLAAVAIYLGRGDADLPQLREILLRSGDTANCRMAAYYISVKYQYSREYKKSQFYARVACGHAQREGRRESIAFTAHQLGNGLLGESVIEEAAQSYETAVQLVPEPGVWRAVALDNLGYCRGLQGPFASGYSC